jgi:hypothetical protein
VNVDEAFIAVVRAIRRYQKVSYSIAPSLKDKKLIVHRSQDHLRRWYHLNRQPVHREDDQMRSRPIRTIKDVVVDV